MLAAALLELVPDQHAFIDRLNSLGLPGVEVSREDSVKCGIKGTHFRVTVNGEEEESLDVHEHINCGGHFHEQGHHHDDDDGAHEHGGDYGHGGGYMEHGHSHEPVGAEHGRCDEECHHDHGGLEHYHEHGGHHHEHDGHHHEHGHHHTSLADIGAIIAKSGICEAVQKDIMAVYGRIAEAESRAHGVPVEQIHFHEVGTLDAVMDIAAVCLLIHELKPEQIIVSPVVTGFGQVRCAHGILPVPAPATAFLLKDVPTYGGRIRGEMCTPTGAALLTHFASRFGSQPVMRVEKIGCGMGSKDFEAANCVRAFLGGTEGAADEIVELSCNIDDMTPEEIGFAVHKLFEAGARDVFTVPAAMKKDRPGVLLTILCKEDKEEGLVQAVFRYTSTIGLRRKICGRYILERKEEAVALNGGTVRVKTSSGYGVMRSKAEYDDVARIAGKEGKTIAEVLAELDSVRKKQGGE